MVDQSLTCSRLPVQPQFLVRTRSGWNTHTHRCIHRSHFLLIASSCITKLAVFFFLPQLRNWQQCDRVQCHHPTASKVSFHPQSGFTGAPVLFCTHTHVRKRTNNHTHSGMKTTETANDFRVTVFDSHRSLCWEHQTDADGQIAILQLRLEDLGLNGVNSRAAYWEQASVGRSNNPRGKIFRVEIRSDQIRLD